MLGWTRGFPKTPWPAPKPPGAVSGAGTFELALSASQRQTLTWGFSKDVSRVRKLPVAAGPLAAVAAAKEEPSDNHRLVRGYRRLQAGTLADPRGDQQGIADWDADTADMEFMHIREGAHEELARDFPGDLGALRAGPAEAVEAGHYTSRP